MARHAELAALLLLDAVALFLAYAAFSGLYPDLAVGLTLGGLGAPTVPSVVLIVGFWIVLFLFAGLYRVRYAESRFDEFVTVFKVVGVGSVLLFFVVFVEKLAPGAARQGVLVYWGLMLGFVGAVRLGYRTVQKALVVRGVGVHRAVIVGWSDQVESVYREVQRYPAAGLRVVGAVRLLPEAVTEPVPSFVGGSSVRSSVGDGSPWAGLPVLAAGTGSPSFTPDGLSSAVHTISALPSLIEDLGVQDVLIALGPNDHAFLDEVLRVCDGLRTREGRPLALKLVPDFYAAVGGMARTEHMYGLPLIEVLPVPTPAWERHAKRMIDLVVSALVLTLGMPLWLALGAAVRMTSAGPAIYRQTRVGQHGKPFTIYKFRTMRQDAEAKTGPVWASKGDRRVTPLGRWLRAVRLDEIPQMLNVLKGEMSLVGPRPERPEFVDVLARQIPLYSRRHRVKPGVTGVAQVKWRYDEDIEDVRQKLKYDLFYIEHMSLRMDFQVLLQTIRTTVLHRGH